MIHSIEAQPTQSYDMSVTFERGPHKDESLRFELSKTKQKAELTQLFKCVSGFLGDNKKYDEKFCEISLGYFDVKDKKTWHKIGTFSLNLAEYVDKGEVPLQQCKFENSKQDTMKACVNLTVKVDIGENVSKISGALQPTAAEIEKHKQISELTAIAKKGRAEIKRLEEVVKQN